MNDLTREQKMDAAKARMAELAARFLDRTQGDLAAMLDGLAKLEAGDATPLAEIRHLAHRMVGTGATLGFESLSERAQRIEQLAEACVPGVMPDETMRAELRRALADLGEELAKRRV